MRLVAFLAACCALSAVAASAQAPAPSPPRLSAEAPALAQRAWAERHLSLDGWTITGHNRGRIWLASTVATVHNDYPLVQDWMRVEYATPPDRELPIASELWRIEVQCERKAMRVLRSITYAGNNLRGRILRDDATPSPDLSDQAPGTLGRAMADAVCKGAESSAERP